jgi:2-hydroxychromene-2-carboxylate isomerase
MQKPIYFYFDFSSPYAYFAAQKIDDVAMEFGGREVEWRPFLLGVAMKETNNEPLMQQPVKGEYSVNDWNRMARFMKVPWTLPIKFPSASVAAARAFYWISDTDKSKAKIFAHRCFISYFSEGLNINDADTVAEIASQVGINGCELKKAIADGVIKDKLRNETQAAIDAGVFGSPFFIVDDEKFWGSDRIWMIKRWLKTGGW